MRTEIANPPVKSYVRVGWVMVALCLAAPLFLSALGFLPAFEAGRLIVHVGFGWLITAIIIDLILRKRSAWTKAKGRIVAATMVLLTTVSLLFTTYQDANKVNQAKKELIEEFMQASINSRQSSTSLNEAVTSVSSNTIKKPEPVISPVKVSSEADRAASFLNTMKALAVKHARNSAAIERKFQAIDLSSVLAPENLVTQTGLQDSYKRLQSYKAVISERDALLANQIAATTALINGSELNESEKRDALACFEEGKGNSEKAYRDLSEAQLTSVKAISNVLDHAKRNLGRTALQDGQLLFQTQAELDEYQGLIHVLNKIIANEEQVTQRVTQVLQQNKESLVAEFNK